MSFAHFNSSSETSSLRRPGPSRKDSATHPLLSMLYHGLQKHGVVNQLGHGAQRAARHRVKQRLSVPMRKTRVQRLDDVWRCRRGACRLRVPKGESSLTRRKEVAARRGPVVHATTFWKLLCQTVQCAPAARMRGESESAGCRGCPPWRHIAGAAGEEKRSGELDGHTAHHAHAAGINTAG